jgi:hypothetical protein
MWQEFSAILYYNRRYVMVTTVPLRGNDAIWTTQSWLVGWLGKGKGKVHPLSGHEGPDVEYRHNSTLFDVRKSIHHHTIQINQPTRCSNFTSLLLDVYVWLNMFRAPLCPSSGAYNCTRSLWFYLLSCNAGAWWLERCWSWTHDQQRSRES